MHFTKDDLNVIITGVLIYNFWVHINRKQISENRSDNEDRMGYTRDDFE